MKRHPTQGVDWAIVFLIMLIVALVTLIISAVAYEVTEDREPTSRCIDARWRIFERDGDFSIAEDLTCAK